MSPEPRPLSHAAVPLATEAPVVARIPYLNAEPFYTTWDELPGLSRDLVPRVLGYQAERGEVDAGLMAVVDYFRLGDRFERIGDLGVACHGTVESVLLLAERPLAGCHGALVRLTRESSTSVELCHLLLEGRLGLRDLRYQREDSEGGGEPGEGGIRLLIGDRALAARRASPGSVVLDLGAAWTQWTGEPFVFAVWAVRKSLPRERRAELEAFLERSLSIGERSLEEIAERCAGESDGRLGTASDLAAYLARFRYRLGAAEERGLALFEKKWKEMRS